MISREEDKRTFDQCRTSMRVSKAATLLEVDISTIYRLVHNGNLEAHRIGKRSIRVFADSLTSYQNQQKIICQPKRSSQDEISEEKKITINTPAHQDAIAYLKSIGCL